MLLEAGSALFAAQHLVLLGRPDGRGQASELIRAGLVDHRRNGFGVPVLSESVYKSACAFPTRSNAAFVRANSFSAFSARVRRVSISRSSSPRPSRTVE